MDPKLPPREFTRAAPARLEGGDGRTLVGRAVPLEEATRVTDPDGRTYLEGFHRTAFNKSLRDRGDKAWPVGIYHPWNAAPYGRTSPIPIGAVRFRVSNQERGLMFEAPLSRTLAADEALELVKDGALSDVSLTFVGHGSRAHAWPAGPGVMRTEVGIRELSLAPTGYGQHAGAEVLAVRALAELEAPPPASSSVTPRLDALKRRRARLIVL